MNKTTTYTKLEAQLVKYRDLVGVTVDESNDPFVELPDRLPGDYGAIGRYQALGDMKETFPQVPVRKSIKEKLDRADKKLKTINPSLQLVVAYGFRSLEVQQNYFELIRAQVIQDKNRDEDLDEIVHRQIAVPAVAGHPTGGAVDVFIQDSQTGSMLEFGTSLFDFDSKDVYVFSPFISETAKKNRALLREILLDEEFAPYDGEWWHFSFGDKEWAFYYKKPFALFEQKSEKYVAFNLNVETKMSKGSDVNGGDSTSLAFSFN